LEFLFRTSAVEVLHFLGGVFSFFFSFFVFRGVFFVAFIFFFCGFFAPAKTPKSRRAKGLLRSRRRAAQTQAGSGKVAIFAIVDNFFIFADF
jgi:hypothetical protein